MSRIATNTAIDFLRRSSRATFCELDEAPESQSESPEQILLRSEHREYLEDGLRLLTARDPFSGITYDDGKIVLPDGPGLGVRETAEIAR